MLVPLLLLGCTGTVDTGGTDASSPGAADAVPACATVPSASFALLPTSGSTTDRPADQHADLNVKMRGWQPTTGELGLIDIYPLIDPNAPRLHTMLSDDRVPAFVTNYAVNDWNWDQSSVGGPIDTWEVTMSGLGTTAGELLEGPVTGYDIGQGLRWRVLFVDDDSITLKAGTEDHMANGYGLHIVGVCPDPTLRELYDQKVAEGRSEMPALAAHQAFGRARSGEVKIAVRDTGSFMDPRSLNDWWQP